MFLSTKEVDDDLSKHIMEYAKHISISLQAPRQTGNVTDFVFAEDPYPRPEVMTKWGQQDYVQLSLLQFSNFGVHELQRLPRPVLKVKNIPNTYHEIEGGYTFTGRAVLSFTIPDHDDAWFRYTKDEHLPSLANGQLLYPMMDLEISEQCRLKIIGLKTNFIESPMLVLYIDIKEAHREPSLIPDLENELIRPHELPLHGESIDESFQNGDPDYWPGSANTEYFY
eukprot:TRINITY_DN1142_c0_g1_i7.p1 TRINITY_DN1142_c0_g1~~TRINITY_DN1142_c0_g1_i7.p1  ORF type:complete len:225 (+),score=31.13 TRINITY_DN1142_c0_g1_i7:128-802(+)